MKGVSVGIYKAYQKPKKETKSKISVSSYLSKSKNNGGVLGGLGYVGGSIAAGVGGIGEGILDLGAAGIALLGGDKEYAKYVFKDNVVGDWHQSLTEDYNPGKVMQFIGDVGQGLGQSATMLIPYVGPYAFFTGVISQGISGAAEKTGDVGFKEVAYGATTGAIEGALEWALGAAGQGAKSIASAIAKRGGKGAAKTLFSTAVRRGLAGKILSSAAGEFLEEAASEVVDVGLQRLYRIDPNASTSLKDVLYAGIVGAVSGGIMGGSVNVVQTLNNRATGRKIVQNGNAQTLINTANLVADKLAGQGTNFRKAPEWVKTLRGEIDAYNKLVEKGEQNSAKGETILGELQASLFFAETQAVASGLAYSIQQSSDENRATLAEYVNQTIPKDKRGREYTAEDIAKDTDGITMQLAILQFAGNEFINYADAISSLEADQAQEGAIGDVVGAMQGEEKPSPSTASTPLPKGEAVQGTAVQGEAVQGEEPSPSPSSDGATSPEGRGVTVNQANAGIFDASAGVSTEGEVAKSDLASPLTDAKYSVATAKRAQKRIKENAARAERARQARLDEEGRMVEGTNQEQSAERKNEPSPSPSSDGATSSEVGGNNEPKIRKPKEEILTDVQRIERAKERAKRLIEYEATAKVTSKELNTAREYVKDFDSIPKGARQAVIKMIRSADGKVDKKILAGVANLMTMRRKNGELVMPDLELRFAEGIVDGGLYTHIGEGENRRVLILINSDADFKETIRGTIAHEIVHYIENRKGYRELADYVLKTAKKEKIAEIEKEYNEHYKGIYTAEAEKAGLTGEAITKMVAEKMATEDHKELIKSEVVAKLIGLRLNNEKFLQKYATKDDAMIKKILRLLRASVSYLKDKDKATADEVRELVQKFDEAIKGNVTSEEKTGTAFDVSPEQIEEWEKPITLQEVEILRTIGPKSINKFTPEELKIAQKWAYKFYKELDVKSPFFRAWFGEWRAYSTDIANIIDIDKNAVLKAGKAINADTNKTLSWNSEALKESTLNASKEAKSDIAIIGANMSKLVENAILLDTTISVKSSNRKLEGTAFMHTFYSIAEVDNRHILVRIYAEEAISPKSGEIFTRAYLLKYIEKVAEFDNSVHLDNESLTESHSTTTYSIADLYKFVNTFDKKFSPAPEVSKYALNEDGTPKVFYHGTNQGEFYEFLWNKTQRADGGFFGRGHYFTASRSMANLYGKRIVEAYLSFKNPFIWSEQIDTRDGNRGSNIIASNLIKRINMARAFPSLFANKKINAGVYNNNTGEYVDTSVEWSELEAKIEEASNTLHLQKFADGTYQWFAPGRFWDESVGDRYSSVEEAESDKFSAASIAFSNKYQGVAQSMSFDDQSTYTQQYGDDITKLLISMKYDASMQNPEGDEVVIFESSKIKSATDNIGTFDKTNPNIKRDLAPRKPDKAEKKIEKLEKEKAEAQAKAKQERSMREKLAREAAQVAKAEAAKVYTKKEIEAALKDVEALTNAEILSLAKGLELKGMTKARRDELISKIYTLLHSASAKGEAGRGSVAVKMIASKIAWDVIGTAKIFDENGKAMHIVDIYDEASVEGIATYLTDTLYNSFANMGEHTSNSYFQAEMRKVKEDFNREFINDRKLQRFTREASFQGTQLRQLAETQKRNMEDEGIQKVTKLLGSIVDNKGNIRIGKVDEAMAEADRFYSGEGGKLYSEQKEADKATLTEFAWESDGDLQFMIEEFIRLRKGREGKFLTATEMEYLAKVMGGLKTIIKRYNKAYIDGRWVDIDEKALDSAEDLKKYAADREYKNKFTKWLGEKADKYLQGVYFYNILTPETVVETLEGFKKNGVLKTLYHTVRVATQKAEHLSVQLKKPFAEFIDDKKNVWEDEKGKKHTYRNKLNKKTVSINGAEITLGEAIYLYMLTKREQAHAGLTESGYVTYDDEGKRKLKIKIEDIERTRDMIAAQLDATDREFLKMAEDFFNKTSTDIKYNADMEIFGYSNIQDGYYVPIIRDRYSRMQGVTDTRQSVASIITVYNKSFNQNTVENAKALEGQNILRIINDHADGLADYSELYLPLKSFDRVYNRKLVLEGGEITSIREILNNEVWTGAQGYFKKLFADIQGQGSERGFLDGMIGKLRSGWVNSVLGANVKVVATQTTSYVAANQLIEAKYLSAAASKFVGNIDEIRERAYKYSDIIEARNFEMGSLRAQGNIDKVNEIGKKSGFLIGWMDERICLSIFHAAELKAEAQGHGAVGTESNSIAAAKIADEVIYTTQAMTSQAERSALQRSKSEVARTLAMFTSDSVKQLSHLYHNVMQFVAHKQRSKSDTAYEAELSKDAKMIGRSAATVLTTGIMLGLITQAFKYLYAQEEEEPEEKVKDFAIDMVSSTFNIMPIVSDIADKFVFGYDLSLNVFDIVNDTIEDTSALFKMTGKAMGGQYVSSAEVGKNLINAAKTYTTLFGVPLAPVERTVTGLMRRFTPSAVYGYDTMFKNPSYTADLKNAVEKGDDRLAEHILGQLYRNEVTGVYTSEELEIVADLYSKGYTSVIPQRVGETINDVKLDRKQRQQFNKIYAQASSKVMEMIATAEFKALSEEQQAKAIKNLYSLYYNRAASTVAGKEVSNAQMYSWLTDDYSALFTSQAYKGGLDVVKDSKGKEVSVRDQFVEYAQNLDLSESDLLVVEFANGVRDKKTRAALIEHINTLTLSDEQKTVIAEKLSLEVKDGKLVEKKE